MRLAGTRFQHAVEEENTPELRVNRELAMKATAKHKAVTSGRLTGGARAQPARRQANPEPAYSLYSTDSELQVTTLHRGLDRCAALLGGILQADATASPTLQRAVPGGAAKSLGKKPVKKAPKKTVHKNPPSAQRGTGSTAPSPQTPTPAAHSGVRLHPPVRRAPAKAHHSPSSPPASVPRSSSQAAPDSEEEEFVPVRDTGAVSCTHERSAGVPDTSPGLGPVEEDGVRVPGTEKTVRRLLGEIKALIAGQGSVAETLLRHLEEAVSSPPLGDGGLNEDPPSLHDQNLQLRRQVMILNQQLHEKAESNSEASLLQDEVTSAQSRLRELQHDLAELRGDLRDAHAQLRGREAEAAAAAADLEAARRRLGDAERERSEWASLAQQRLEEIGNLKRTLQSRGAEPLPTAARQQPNERVAHYLMSLGGGPGEPASGAPPPAPESRRGSGGSSLWSDRSARPSSASTFDTRDEAAFRDGLAALDASIASLQRTMQLDLRR